MIRVSLPRRTLSGALACAAALSTLACRSTSAPDTLSVHLLLSSAVVPSGGTTSVTISATNVGDAALTINDSCEGEYRTISLRGDILRIRQFCSHILILRMKTLAPGEQVSYVQTWEATGDQGALPPGEYRVVGFVSGRSSDAVRLTVQ
jgi:hypothetical protein